MAYAASNFHGELFNAIAKGKSTENIILSPASIKICLALAYLGAEGNTAAELHQSLQLAGSTKQQVAENFATFLAKTREADAKLQLANRVYVDEKFEISKNFNELASKYFAAAAENVRFENAKEAANTINSWVEQHTANKIQNLISADSFDASTAAVLVNAIYFKANWTNFFDSYLTSKADFALNADQKVSVDMMSQEDTFAYGELADLNATAIQLTYVDTDISMLIILPKSLDGLANLESQLQHVDLNEISEQLKKEKVRLSLPKFKIEFDLSLQPILEQLGMKTLFTKQADFSNLLQSSHDLYVSEVKHKAFIEVNEMGTEAAAATFAKVSLESLILNEVIYDFKADHPFFFAIKDKEQVYFIGHIAKF